MNRKLLMALLGAIGICFVFFPNIVSQGAKAGLDLWFSAVMPALLPFMILSTFMIRQNITDYVSTAVYPLFRRIFGLSRGGCYPAVIGLLSGYPIGAKTTAGLYQEKKISRQEAQYLLSFCNNASPMFLLEYIGVQCMGLRFPLAVLLIIYLSGWINSFFWRRGMRVQREENGCPENGMGGASVIASLDESILDSFVTITKVGGYILLFSIFAKLIDAMLPISAIIKSVGIGILEITIGAVLVKDISAAENIRFVIMLFLCAFGGLSSVAQTASVLRDTDLSVGGYLLAKFSQACVAAVLALIWYAWG
ncbi:MAG: hypothetical protein LUH14_03205 [Clostridiaceae bacterium]|nr:hypothetical protein [Clostridiaceae bacterium]